MKLLQIRTNTSLTSITNVILWWSDSYAISQKKTSQILKLVRFSLEHSKTHTIRKTITAPFCFSKCNHLSCFSFQTILCEQLTCHTARKTVYTFVGNHDGYLFIFPNIYFIRYPLICTNATLVMYIASVVMWFGYVNSQCCHVVFFLRFVVGLSIHFSLLPPPVADPANIFTVS